MREVSTGSSPGPAAPRNRRRAGGQAGGWMAAAGTDGPTWPGAGPRRLPLSHSPMSGCYRSISQMKTPRFRGMDLGSHDPAPPQPLEAMGPPWRPPGTAGSTEGGEDRKVAEAPETGCASECRRVQGEGSLVRGARAGLGPKEGVPGVLTSSHLTRRAAKSRAGPARPLQPHGLSGVGAASGPPPSGPGSRPSWGRLT